MDGSDSARDAPASITCDPTNYDWYELDQDGKIFPYSFRFRISDSCLLPLEPPGQRRREINTTIARSIETAPGLPDIANGTAYNTWRSQPSPKTNLPNVPTTDAPLVDTADLTSARSADLRAKRPKAKDRDVVDSMCHETMMRLSNELMPILEPDADTLLYIGVPPQVAGQTDYEYAYICRQFRRPYLLRSDTLRKLDSAKFNDLLGPKSARTQRRLQKAGIHKLVLEPAKIKYFVDLSPNIHDDEGMVLLTQLSAPSSVLAWHKSARRFNIDTTHVCGRDAFDVPAKPIYSNKSQAEPVPEPEDKTPKTEEVSVIRTVAREGCSPSEKKATAHDLPEEDDYSQLRHYTAIARLLHAIAGNDPKLNSAPKLWTFCMLAKFFDCAKNNLINRWVTDWLIQCNNLNFVQVNPSASYRLGMAIEAIWLVRTGFSIIVGQKAFANTAPDLKEPSAFPFQPANKITEDLDDDDINRVDHAASALVRRVRDALYELLRENGAWLTHANPGSALGRLYAISLGDPNARSAVKVAQTSLDRYIRRLLCNAFIEVDYTKKNTGDLLKSANNITALYNDIPALARPLTLQFWEALKKEDFTIDHAETHYLGNRNYWARTLETLIHEDVIAPEIADIPYVSKWQLLEAVEYLSNLDSYPYATNAENSPKKKVKLSPQQNRTSYSPAVVNDVQSSLRTTPPGKPVLKPKEASTSKFHDVPTQPTHKWESESDWDEHTETFIGTPNYSEDEEWEDLLVDPQMQQKPSVAARSAPAQDLPVRTKPSFITTPVTANVAPLEQHYGSTLDANVSVNLYPYGYGNPNPPQPDNAPHLVRARQQPAMKSKSCESCSLRQIECNEGCPECGQCTRMGHFCEQVPSQHLRSEQSESSRANLDRYTPATPSQNPQYGGWSVPPIKSVFAVADGKNESRDVHLADSTSIRTAAMFSKSDTKPDDVLRAIKDRMEQRQSQFAFQSPKLRVANPEIPDIAQPATFLQQKEVSRPNTSFSFLSSNLFLEVHNRVGAFVRPLLTPGYVADGSCAYDIPTNEVGVLTSLSQDEYKYLPLWAGGNDDGTGGVFDDGDEIPEAPEVEDGGFRGGAMGIIPGVGSSVGGSMAGSEFEEIMTEVGVSTVGKASRIATDGEETVMSMDE